MTSRILPLVIISLLGTASFSIIIAGSGFQGGDDTPTLLMLLGVGVVMMLALARFVPPIMQERRHRKAEKMRELQQMQHARIN